MGLMRYILTFFLKSDKQFSNSFSGSEKSVIGSFLFVHSNRKMIRIGLDEIQYVENQKDTIKIVADSKTLQVR